MDEDVKNRKRPSGALPLELVAKSGSYPALEAFCISIGHEKTRKG
jgi:hypothetical protein